MKGEVESVNSSFPAKRSLRSKNSAGSGKAIRVNGRTLFK